MDHLMAIALGPVQEFIATARRFRDFYAGSRLLSEAAARAARHLAQAVGPENLIFPAPKDLGELEELGQAGIPNVLLLRVPEGKDPASLGEEALGAARGYLREMAEKTLGPHRAHLRYPEALAQVEDLLEGYYAYLPLGDYAQTRGRLMALLSARKNTRDFAPVFWGGPLYKSSLDGARESVLDFRQDEARLRRRLGIKEGEYLSGPDLLKRLWQAPPFPSSTHMAALPFWEGVRARKAEGVLEEALEELAHLAGEEARTGNPHPALRDTPFARLDVRLLYESRLEEFPALAEDEGRLEAARSRLASLWKELRKRGVKAPPGSYYALLLADGDRMGEAIDRQTSLQAHRELSRRLALEFAQKVRALVEGHRGGLVYSGGDDVLALLPLHTALRAAWDLAQRFQEVMAPYGQDGVRPSLSVGLAVVHHLEPLQDALDLVRRAEKLAKSGYKGEAPRNALAVAYSPRSGSELVVRGRWDEEPRLTQRLLRYADLLRTETVPGRAAYELVELLRMEKDLPDHEKPLLREALVAEARRILGRKQMEAGYREELSPSDWVGVKRLAEGLLLARPFAEALEQAAVPAESLEVWRAH
ncbi:type III-B CRISPR-associated protein Cas10/Cmr2 [Thermus filiformis]|uniref:CRISPR-associated protein Crm2 n=1 Tax=Thermus filiformis TaxID=276 RepID=A0A0A2WNG2_THEFI|nr:type III-B CRISPR-associated protein Cas10/Cmr2 [Thermus filiformis]KGQ21368.2 CRISPR-associated protein Crm2 [Thermus filiformis]